ncbi:DUF554 domain-containing protein [Dysgonomonas sp. 521]|uniref:DUF554 domain-containing protein n=1 Tax=Dysgonomonas sp. 521 TaxID=2302932 RepID=UPI0013D5D7F9|nr:DUF554 domain-containing protein [Dysgonomonas sp. 521]NDV94601.1 DUF554 domain-containing protein [Dysgonomonas sp. 521]
MVGTLVNTAAVIAGGAVGLLIHSRLSARMTNIVFQGIGLVTLAIGISMSLHIQSMILVVVSIVLGAITGQAIDIDKYLRRFSDSLQKKGRRKVKPGDEESAASNRFSEGFITASMLFCIGSMAILGAIEDGMGKTPNLLYTKSIMDGISAIALASSFGVCILLSSIPVLIYQGSLTLFAAFIMRYMSESMTENMTGVGGILLIGLAINILKIKDINVTNMLPALVIVVLLSYFF